MKKCKTRWWNFINVNLYNSLFFFNTATIKQFIKKSIESIRIPISKFSSSKKFLSRIKKHKRENSFSSIVTFLPFSLLIEKGLARWWRSRPSSLENTTPSPSCRQHDVVPYRNRVHGVGSGRRIKGDFVNGTHFRGSYRIQRDVHWKIKTTRPRRQR